MRSTPTSAPNIIPPKPATARGFLKPVAWLLGPQLLASLKWVALYTAFKGKLDPRDWMQAEVYDCAATPRGNTDVSTDEFWFDYMSDTGDGQRAMYSLAYLCYSDLWVASSASVGTETAFERQRIVGDVMRLPRGEFLFVGGDTAYPTADYPSLVRRFQTPFHWAYNDLKAQGRATDAAPRRPLFGLPGNHDYYDVIDGFNRQFCRPTSDEDTPNQAGLPPLLSIPGFRRYQTASYTALQLPFDWWLWAVDDEVGNVDIRQHEFFARLHNGIPPTKLIVATPEPTTALGRRAQPDDQTAKTFANVHLEQPFLEGQVLPSHKCRLDLAGDTHAYARYWGSAAHASTHAPTASNYASVVSGLGGAFLHPSHVDAGAVPAQVVYPQPEVSRQAVARRLFDPVHLIKGGYVMTLGAIIAAVIYCAALIMQSSKVVVDRFLYTLLSITPSPPSPLAGWLPPVEPPMPGDSVPLTRLRVGLPVILLGISLVLMVLNVVWLKKATTLPHQQRPKLRVYVWLVIGALLVSVLCLALGAKPFLAQREHLAAFDSHVLVVVALLWAGAALVAGVLHREVLMKCAYPQPVSTGESWLVWVLIALAVGVLGAGLLFFGRHAAVYVVSDVVFMCVVAGIVLGLMVLAIFVGGAFHGVLGKLGFGLLGAWHALLQLAVPFLLVRLGAWPLWLLTIGIVALFVWIGNWLLHMPRHTRWRVVLAWGLYGALLLVLPFVWRSDAAVWLHSGSTWLRLVVAMLFGALLSCVWLGWYLVIALDFNGHPYEAGGAARMEEFQQFIRFRLTENELTGYVIAIDEPQTDGARLHPTVIDVFQVRVG
jgi:hypothetical protein